MKLLSAAVCFAMSAAVWFVPALAADDVFINKGSIKWGEAPPALPKGAKVAVLHGDPFKAGQYILRLSMPANYRIPPHWHSQAEHLTVISGALHLGMGDKADAKAARALTPGGFHYLPAKAHHYAFTKSPAVIQVSGEGPFDINYLNPADNPEKKAAKK